MTTPLQASLRVTAWVVMALGFAMLIIEMAMCMVSMIRAADIQAANGAIGPAACSCKQHSFTNCALESCLLDFGTVICLAPSPQDAARHS